MRRFAPLVLAVVITGCTSASDEPGRGAAPRPSPSSTATRGGPPARIEREIHVYAAVVRRLVKRDHTFGRGPSPFEHVYIVDGPVPGAERVPPTNEEPVRRFDPSVRQGLIAALTELPPIDFIADPDEVRKPRLGAVKNHGVIITLAPIKGGPRKVTVGNGLWCGGLCGQWQTYVVKKRAAAWEVTGTTGPYAIS